jgi:hypothetical protein
MWAIYIGIAHVIIFTICLYLGKKLIKISLSNSCHIIQQGILYATCRICQRQKNDTLCRISQGFFFFVSKQGYPHNHMFCMCLLAHRT